MSFIDRLSGEHPDLKSLYHLYISQLKDIYDAECQFIEAIPKMEEAATDPSLKAAFRDHLEVTKRQKLRLERLFQDYAYKPGGETCPAAKGLIKEAREMIAEESAPSVLDAALIAAAQKIEHYEVASYGTLCAWAKRLKDEKACRLLHQSLEEERDTDLALTRLAEQGINRDAELWDEDHQSELDEAAE
jgi:ferritin-like metal-binding protein YciE